MVRKPSRFSKVFGSGPVGLAISVVLVLVAVLVNGRNPLPLSHNQSLLNAVFLVSIVLTLVVIVWSVKSLPATDRGNKLCTGGAFKYVRHPLYAAFLCIFDFGLAIFLNSYVFIVWAVLLHPIWNWAVRPEEQLMIDAFGEPYREYMRHTGRFVPRLRIGK